MLQGSFNIRGLKTKSGDTWVFRSAALDDATEKDFETLSAFGVTQVIDLRSRGERGIIRHPFAQTVLPLYGEDALPPEHGDLEEIYQSILTQSGALIAEAAHIVASNSGVTLIHCRVGKDRTGLVIALIALASGAEEAEVLEDYALSGAEVRKNTADAVEQELAALNLSADDHAKALELHLESPVKALQQTLAWISANFGSVTEYLLKFGLSEADLTKLRAKYRDASTTTKPEEVSQR